MRFAPWILLTATISSASADAVDPDVTATSGGADAAAPRWPRGVIDRPLTLPAGLVLAGPDAMAFRDATGNHLNGDVGLGIGITDDIELNTLTPTGTFGLVNSGAGGPWDAGLGVKLLRGAFDGKLEVIARAVGGYDASTHAARPIRIGFHAQYNVTSTFAVFTHDTGVMPGVSIDPNGDHAVTLGLPVGAGVQLTPTLWLEADTNLVTAYAVHAGSTMTAADVVPAFATAVWNVADGALDLLAYTGCNDCAHARDTAFFGLGTRYYAGSR